MSARAVDVDVSGLRGRIEPFRLGIWLFLVTEAMFFAGLIAAHLALKGGSAQWTGSGDELDLQRAWIATAMLVTSSLVLSRALVAIRNGRAIRVVRRWMAGAIVLGALFLAMQSLEFRALAQTGIGPRTSLSWSSFFVLTSVHALHVLAGLVWLAFAWSAAGRGRYAREHHLGLEMAGIYWHFVDVVWVGLFALLYLA